MNTPEKQLSDRRAERDALRRSLRAADEELSALILREKVTLRGYLDPIVLEQQRDHVRAALNTLDAKGEQLPYTLSNTDPNRHSSHEVITHGLPSEANGGEDSEGPETGGHKPLMRNRQADDAAPAIGHTDGNTFTSDDLAQQVWDTGAALNQLIQTNPETPK